MARDQKSNRQRVLDAIAGAQAGAASGIDVAQHEPTSALYNVNSAVDADHTALLIDRLVDYKARVLDLRTADGSAEIADAIGLTLGELGRASVVVHPDFPQNLRPTSLAIVEDHGLTHVQLDALDATLTTCSVAIAETGTIILDHEGAQGRRAISLIPDVHVCLVREDQIRGTVPEGVRGMGSRGISTWISGPSATSDIELSRVEGVHGPRTLVVVLYR
jgi:L-lactate utilization protein LutC